MEKTPNKKFHLLVVLLCYFGSVGSTRCDAGWELNRGNCFFFSTDDTTGYRARAECAARNARLADVETEGENSFIANKIGTSAHWIGLRRTPSMWNWVAYGMPLSQDYTNWMPGEPNNAGGDEMCAVMRTCGRWIDVPCSQSRNFVCKNIKPDRMPCGSSWREHQGYCYFFSRQKTTSEGAKQQCELLSAILVDVFSHAENSFVRANLHGYSWMGLQRSSAKWSWNDQAAEIGYSSWDSGEPNARRGNSCGDIGAGGKWKAKTCSYVRQRYVCETDAEEECEVLPFGECSTTCGEGTKSRVRMCMREGIMQFNRETLHCDDQPACGDRGLP